MQRPSTFSTLMAFAVLALAGFALVPRLTVRFLPSVQAPSLMVRFTWPDASPEVIEQEVASPLEGAFSLVQGVEGIYSISGRGQGSLRLDLDKNSPRELLRFEVASKIRQVFPQLPQGVSFPQLTINDPNEGEAERPLLTWSLSSDATSAELHAYATDVLSPQIALVPGIRKTEIVGGNRTEWVITYDASAIRQLGLTKNDLSRTIRQSFSSAALGAIAIDEEILYVRLSSNNDSGHQLANIPIVRKGNRTIRLGDVADIRTQEQQPNNYYRINGRTSLRLLIHGEAAINTIAIAREAKNKIVELAKVLPPTYRLHLDEDATEHLVQELQKIKQRTVWSLSILLLFVLLTYRSWRYLLIIVSSLLANLGLAAICYFFFHVELHLYALAAITVSFGILIDNTVVLSHHLQQQGNLKVFPAMLASTLTTIAALVVIWFLPEQWQLNLFEFARVLAINLAVSLLVAVWFVPALMERLGMTRAAHFHAPLSTGKRQTAAVHHLYRHVLLLLFRFRKAAILFVILLFGTPIFLLPNKVEGWDFYNKYLGSDWFLEHAKPAVNKWLGGTLRLFTWYVWEGGNFRQPEETVLYVQASMPLGASASQMNEVMKKVDAYLTNYPKEIKKYITNVISGERASARITFNEGHAFSFPHQLKSRLIAFSLNLGGVKWNIYGVGQGFSNDGGSTPPRFRIKMLGYNKDELETQAKRFAKKLIAHPRIQEVNTEANINWWDKDRYAYEMDLNRTALAEHNFSAFELRPVFENFDLSKKNDLFLPGNKPVRLVSDEVAGNDLWQLREIPQQMDSQQVMLSEIGCLKKQKVASSIHKEDQQYIRMVEFEYTGSYRFGSQFLKEKMEEMKKEMLPGYRMEERRGNWRQEQQKQYALLLLVIGLIFFICAVMFESLQQALAIVFMIPLSFIGIFLTYYWFDFPFDQGGYTSFLLVSGLTVNSLILIINDYNGLRKKTPAASSLDLYLKAFYQKITPILLSIVSTTLGLLPFTLHGQHEPFWFSLAVGAMGGLLFSIVVITFFIPLFFVKNKPVLDV